MHKKILVLVAGALLVVSTAQARHFFGEDDDAPAWHAKYCEALDAQVAERLDRPVLNHPAMVQLVALVDSYARHCAVDDFSEVYAHH